MMCSAFRARAALFVLAFALAAACRGPGADETGSPSDGVPSNPTLDVTDPDGSTGGTVSAGDGDGDPGSSYDKDGVPAVLWITTTPDIDPESITEEEVTGNLRVIEEHDGTHASPEEFGTMPAALETAITLHVRGNSSTYFDKKGYALEFQGPSDQIKLPLLGMPKEADWVLHGPWTDKTYLRNALAYWLGREIYRGADGKIEAGRYNPRTRFTELYLNGQYWGVYVVIERVKADADRIDVDRPAETSIIGDITGGYIVRREGGGNAAEGKDWVSTVDETIYTHHYPKKSDITPDQESYIHDYFDEFEAMMNSPKYDDPETGYPAYIDEKSFIDYFLAMEWSNNVDGYYKSVYFVKQTDLLGGKLFLSPLWDFNIAFGNADYRNGSDIENWVYMTPGGEEAQYYPPGETPFLTAYFKKLWADPEFLQAMYCRFAQLRTGPLETPTIHNQIDAWALQLANAEERDHARWETLGEYLWPNPVVWDTYEQEITALKTFITDRFAFMDGGLAELAPSTTCN